MKHIILCTLVLSVLIILPGCQAGEQLGDQVERSINQLARLPDLVVQGIINLIGSIGQVGEALTGMIRDMIGNMTGK